MYEDDKRLSICLPGTDFSKNKRNDEGDDEIVFNQDFEISIIEGDKNIWIRIDGHHTHVDKETLLAFFKAAADIFK